MTERVRPPISGEPVTFTPDLIGLQSRLLLGDVALNPRHDVADRFNPDNLPSFDSRSYRTFEAASTSERTSYWNNSGVNNPDEQLMVWSHSLSSLVTNKSFSESEQAFYARIGIDTNQFSTEDAFDYYRDNFADNPNKLKTFVEDAILAHYDEESASFDYDALMSNMDTITWFAHIFGSQSADIMAQLVDAEVKLLTEPEIFTQDPNRINNLTPRETEILGFAWQHHFEEPARRHPERENEDEQREPSHEGIDPYNVADRLVDYESGAVTGESIDLLPYYSGFVENVRSKFESGHPLFQDRDSKLILSDLAVVMIDRVASRANEIDGELAFAIQGNNLVHNERLVAVGAYIAPASDFVNPSHSQVDILPEVHRMTSENLSRNTNLDEYFRQSAGMHVGNPTAVLHIHHDSLGSTWRIQPSRQDYRAAVNALANGNMPFFVWGVVTKSHDQLAMRVFFTKRKQSGRISHKEIQVVYESNLENATSQAA